ncbi:MAG: hypothetical protein U0166_16850 [Acidobacteriota bacterium]
MPFPVLKVQSFPPEDRGRIGDRASCTLVRRNFGHGLAGSSGTS